MDSSLSNIEKGYGTTLFPYPCIMIDKSYSDFGHYIIYSVPVTVPVPLKTTCLFTRKCFDLCINTVCIQSILLQKFQSRTGLTKRIIDPDLHHPGRCFLRKYVTYCTSQSTDHGMFLYCYDPAGLSCRRYDQLLIQWFDGMDVDDFASIPSAASFSAASRQLLTGSPVAMIVRSFPSLKTTPFPSSN